MYEYVPYTFIYRQLEMRKTAENTAENILSLSFWGATKCFKNALSST
jgi:hypothetical protein